MSIKSFTLFWVLSLPVEDTTKDPFPQLLELHRWKEVSMVPGNESERFPQRTLSDPCCHWWKLFTFDGWSLSQMYLNHRSPAVTWVISSSKIFSNISTLSLSPAERNLSIVFGVTSSPWPSVVNNKNKSYHEPYVRLPNEPLDPLMTPLHFPLHNELKWMNIYTVLRELAKLRNAIPSSSICPTRASNAFVRRLDEVTLASSSAILVKSS